MARVYYQGSNRSRKAEHPREEGQQIGPKRHDLQQLEIIYQLRRKKPSLTTKGEYTD